MPATVPERLFALYSFLLSREYPVSRDRIRDSIEAYRRAGSDAAFERTFERDKAALRSLGMKLSATQNFGETVYRIERENLWLDDLEFTPAERLTLGIAARLWSDPAYTRDAQRAVRRLGYTDDIEDGGLDHLSARLNVGGGQLEDILKALSQGDDVIFGYRAADALASQQRRMRPWGVGQRFGHWYVSGWDADRMALRNFRLSRMTEIVTRESTLPGPSEDFSMASVLEGISEAPAPTILMTFPVDALPIVLDWAEAGNGVRLSPDDVIRCPDDPETLTAEGTTPDLHELVTCLAELGRGVVVDSGPDSAWGRQLVDEAVEKTVRRALDLQRDVSALVASGEATVVDPKRGRHRESNDRRFVRLVDLASFVGNNPGCGIREIAEHLGATPARVRQDLEAIANAGDELMGSAHLRIEAHDDEVFVQIPEELEQPLNLAPDQTIRLLLAVQLLGELSRHHSEITAEISRKLVRTANAAGVHADQFSVRVEPGLAKIVEEFREWARQGTAVSMMYRSRGQSALSTRNVVPRDVYSKGDTWYLDADSLDHGGPRTYRIEAVGHVHPLDDDAAGGLRPSSDRELPQEPERTLVWVDDDAPLLAAALGGDVIGHANVPRPHATDRRPAGGTVLEVPVIDWFGLYRLMLHHAGSMALWRQDPWKDAWVDEARRRGLGTVNPE